VTNARSVLSGPSPANPLLPAPNRHHLTPVLFLLITLSLIPALVLAVSRIQFETAQKAVSIVMDYSELTAQANLNGLAPLDLLARYRRLGANGVSVYEDTIVTLENRAVIYRRPGTKMLALYPGQGVNSQLTYTRDLNGSNVLKGLVQRYRIPTRSQVIGGEHWTVWPTDPSFLPAGPNTVLIRALKAQGYVVVYRPYDNLSVKAPGSDWPDVPFLAFNDDKIIGARDPALLQQIRERLGNRVPAIITGSLQEGLDRLVAGHKAIRLFSMGSDEMALLTPDEAATQFVLAASDGGHKLLYVRPFNTIPETEKLLTGIQTGLDKAGLHIGVAVATAYEPSTLLRWLCILGPLSALLLIGLSYPLTRLGLIVAAVGLLTVFIFNTGQLFPSFALLAAISFPALGLVMRRSRTTDWFVATGFSLVGALFVSALGTDRNSILGLESFKGTDLTLLAPILLVGLSFLPRQDVRKTIHQVYVAPVSLGGFVLMSLVLGILALGLVLPNASGGASGTGTKLPQSLHSSVLRSSLNGLVGQISLLLGLSNLLPGSFTLLLLLGGVIGQASILNTFSQFQVPLLIGFRDGFFGLGASLILGYAVLSILKLVLRLWNGQGKWTNSENPKTV
jgi:hypothetical protein